MGGSGWIGVDLDGTLAYYDRWRGSTHIGAPLTPMVERVQSWLAEGRDVRIFTARVSEAACDRNEATRTVVESAIEAWCVRHVGRALPITCAKDFQMVELWDDRCVQMVPNTGLTLADSFAAERMAQTGTP